jgi:hypothetical protein
MHARRYSPGGRTAGAGYRSGASGTRYVQDMIACSTAVPANRDAPPDDRNSGCEHEWSASSTRLAYQNLGRWSFCSRSYILTGGSRESQHPAGFLELPRPWEYVCREQHVICSGVYGSGAAPLLSIGTGTRSLASMGQVILLARAPNGFAQIDRAVIEVDFGSLSDKRFISLICGLSMAPVCVHASLIFTIIYTGVAAQDLWIPMVLVYHVPSAMRTFLVAACSERMEVSSCRSVIILEESSEHPLVVLPQTVHQC